MVMDFAFLSTSRDRSVAENFGSAEKTVIFEVLFIAACPGVDVELLSLYPAEKEILFSPCTGLSLALSYGVQSLLEQMEGQHLTPPLLVAKQKLKVSLKHNC